MSIPIRVLIADDDPSFRDALAELAATEPGIEIVGRAEDGAAAVALTAECEPDIVLMDYKMPRLNGADATKQITSLHSRVRVIAVTMRDGIAREQMLAAGAVDFVSKFDGRDKLLGAIRTHARRR